jgi:UPF0271 protein
MDLSHEEARDYLTYQTGALRAFCDSESIELQHIKPHGALYNMAANNPDLATAIIESVKDFRPEPILLVLAKSNMQKLCEDAGVRIAREAFADRAYNLDGTLVSRKEKGAVIKSAEQIEERITRMVKESKALSVDGKTVDLGKIDSICVHGDNPEAISITSTIRSALSQGGVEVCPLRQFL